MCASQFSEQTLKDHWLKPASLNQTFIALSSYLGFFFSTNFNKKIIFNVWDEEFICWNQHKVLLSHSYPMNGKFYAMMSYRYRFSRCTAMNMRYLQVSPYCCHMTSDVITQWLVQYWFPLLFREQLEWIWERTVFYAVYREEGSRIDFGLESPYLKKEAKLRISLIIKWISL